MIHIKQEIVPDHPCKAIFSFPRGAAFVGAVENDAAPAIHICITGRLIQLFPERLQIVILRNRHQRQIVLRIGLLQPGISAGAAVHHIHRYRPVKIGGGQLNPRQLLGLPALRGNGQVKGDIAIAIHRGNCSRPRSRGRVTHRAYVRHVPIIGDHLILFVPLAGDRRIAGRNAHENARFFGAVRGPADVRITPIKSSVDTQRHVNDIGAQLYRIFNCADDVVAVAALTGVALINLHCKDLGIRGHARNPAGCFVSVRRSDTAHVVAVPAHPVEDVVVPGHIAVSIGNLIGKPLTVAQLRNQLLHVCFGVLGIFYILYHIFVQVVHPGIDDGDDHFLPGIAGIAQLPGLINLGNLFCRNHLGLISNRFRNRCHPGHGAQRVYVAPAHIIRDGVHDISHTMHRLQPQRPLYLVYCGFLAFERRSFSGSGRLNALNRHALQRRLLGQFHNDPDDFIFIPGQRLFCLLPVFPIGLRLCGEEHFLHSLLQRCRALRLCTGRCRACGK